LQTRKVTRKVAIRGRENLRRNGRKRRVMFHVSERVFHGKSAADAAEIGWQFGGGTAAA